MHRFYIEPDNIDIPRSMVRFGEDEARHITKVLRFESGDIVYAFDGSGAEYRLELIRAGVLLIGRILEVVRPEREPRHQLVLVQGLAKADRMDTVVQKAVEIGVSDIIPVITRFSVVRLENGKKGSKTERWQHIAREACKQSRRTLIPTVHTPLTLKEFWDELPAGLPDGHIIMAYENAEPGSLQAAVSRINLETSEKIYLLIGPEGGWDQAEADQARVHGACMVSLGPRILRTETAGLVLASLVLQALGDLG